MKPSRSHDVSRQAGRMALAAMAALALAHRDVAAATTAPAKEITAKPGAEVTLSIKAGAAARCALQKVLRSGQAVPTPPNMALDANTGAFRWTPRPSQAGKYELTFLVYDRDHPQGREVPRRIDVRPGAVTTDRGEVGKLLKQWYAKGTAAGNTGDVYDNRDRGHSHLNMRKFPQLDKFEYPEPLKARRLDWALQLHMLFKHVTIGNSSTASGPTSGGCNSRRAILNQRFADVIYRQYKNSHLYIYPEHRDHDPGRNGRGGYGDLFPANVPYLITSQGSSGSDRPFMEAAAFTLAAFRPEVKKKLIAAGLLMPTVQMVFRACVKGVAYPAEYLTGKAHPTVFEGGKVDALAMIKLAHQIRAETVPPMVQLTVIEEDEATPGRDYFDPRRTEKLFDTPAAIARIVRSVKHVRRMVVSAKASYDTNGRPLKYHWAVLRGDAERIKIRPRNKEGSEVELLVPYHGRRPIRPGAKMESARVDIGAFVHNGKYYSAPGFVCFYSLANEARTYDKDGRVLEVAYGWSDSTIGYPTDEIRDGKYDVADWQGLLGVVTGDDKGLAASLLRKHFGPGERADLKAAAKEFAAAVAKEAEPKEASDAAEAARKKARAAADDAKKKLADAKKARTKGRADQAKSAVEAAEKALKDAEAARKEADKRASDAQRKLRDARRPADRVLTASRPALDGSLRDRLERALNAIKDDAGLYFGRADESEKLLAACKDAGRKKTFQAARDELVRLGIAANDNGRLRLTPVVGGTAPAAERLTRYERSRVAWFNIAIMKALLYPGMLNLSYRANYVSHYVASPKSWRDVYRYATDGRPIGWTRYEKGKKSDFTADGALIAKRDKLGRALEARRVQYLVDRDNRGRPREVKVMTLPDVLRYEYASDADLVGRVREP